MPMAATPRMGMPTAVMIKPMMAGQGILPGHLAEVDGEDQVSGPEEHSEQCSGNKNFLPER